MKILLLTAALALISVNAYAQAGKFGAGVVVGDPTGVTVKYWIDNAFAFDAGVGFSGDATFYGDLLWHSWNIIPQPERGRMGAYVGVGPRVETDRDSTVGLRTLAG